MPGTVVGSTVILIAAVPAPVIEVGLKLTVTPVGCPVADREMAELNPPVTALVMVEVPNAPCAKVREAGEADKLNPGAGAVPRSALISAGPFGLPQPVARSYPVVAEKPLLPLMMSWKAVP